MAFQGEAVSAVPAHCTGARILPNDGFHGLPVATLIFLNRLVRQFRQREHFPVEGVDLAHESAVEDRGLRNSEDDRARTLAVEILIFKNQGVAIGVKQFDAADELKVLAEDGQLLGAVDLFAILLREAGNDRRSEGEVLFRFRLVVGRDYDELTARSGDARRGDDPDHVVADMLEAGDGDAVGEDDLADFRETGTVDGHRLSGHDLRREEHLDAQSEVRRLVDLARVAGRQGPYQDD